VNALTKREHSNQLGVVTTVRIFRFLFFSNHYNQRRGRCFVKIFYGHPDLNVETIYDATEGIGKPPVVTSIGGNDESANESKEHLTVAAEIRD
jgi:hypothetical protein